MTKRVTLPLVSVRKSMLPVSSYIVYSPAPLYTLTSSASNSCELPSLSASIGIIAPSFANTGMRSAGLFTVISRSPS